MGLFDGLFGGDQTASNSLFNEQSKFRQLNQEQAAPAVEDKTTENNVAVKEKQDKKSSKKRQVPGNADASIAAAAPQGTKQAKKAQHAVEAAKAAAPSDKQAAKKGKPQSVPAHGDAAHAEPKQGGGKKRKERPQDEDAEEQEAAPSKQPTKGGKAAKGGKAPKKPTTEPKEEGSEDADNDARPQHVSLTQKSADAKTGEAAAADSDDDDEGEAKEAAEGKPKLTPEEQAERLTRTLFVGNVPIKMKPKALKTLFSQYGKVESVRLRSVPIDLTTKFMPRRAAVLSGKVSADRGSANAYVVFAEKESVEKALAANMTEVEGHHIRVDRASAPRASRDAQGKTTGTGGEDAEGGSLYDPTRSIFVGNLHFAVTDEEVISFFSDAEQHAMPELSQGVEAVRVVRDKSTNIGKGFAFVLFKTKTAARAALSLNEKELKGRALRITRASASKAPPAPAGGKPARGGAPGGKGAGRGPAGAGGKPGGPRGKPGVAADPSTWQGVKVKGKLKGVRGSKGGSGRGGADAPAANRARPDKRPAVAARKAKELAQAKPGKAQEQQGDKGKPAAAAGKPAGKAPAGKAPAGKAPAGKPPGGKPFGRPPAGKPEGGKPAGGRPFGKPPGDKPAGKPFGKPPGGKPEGGKPAGGRPFGKPPGGKPAGKPFGRPAGGPQRAPGGGAPRPAGRNAGGPPKGGKGPGAGGPGKRAGPPGGGKPPAAKKPRQA